MLPLSKSTEEFLFNAKRAHIINLSYVYAFKNGDIGMYGSGRIPIKNEPIKGAFIKDGTSILSDWQGFIPDHENPQILNPESGYIVACNNRFASDHIKHHSSFHQKTTPRAIRADEIIRDFIAKGKKIGIEDNLKMLRDVEDVYVREIKNDLIDFILKIDKSLASNVEIF